MSKLKGNELQRSAKRKNNKGNFCMINIPRETKYMVEIELMCNVKLSLTSVWWIGMIQLRMMKWTIDVNVVFWPWNLS